MANENVKIIVQEVDETRPRGSGESSDIVYVPGLCTAFAPGENRNVPILCRSVDEFEEKFGSVPFQFDDDYEYGDEVKVHRGDYDKSYIYAKELLNAGLTVLYDAICPSEHKLANIADFESEDKTVAEPVRNSRNAFTVSFEDDGNATSKTFTVKFNLESCKTVYGGVSLLTESHMSGFTTELSSLTAPSDCDKFHVDGNSISWDIKDGVQSADLDKYFTAVISVSRTNSKNKKGNISVSLVEGLDISSTAETFSGNPLDYFYGKIIEHLQVLTDKNEYNVKYITTGGYPSFVEIYQEPTGSYDYSIATTMLSVAADRNDAVAIIDHPDYKEGNYELSASADGGFYQKVNTYFSTRGNTEFGTMFTPWGNYSCVTMDDPSDSLQAMPASFGYLLCLASAIKTSPNWLAMAGVTRGIVPNLLSLRTSNVLSNVIAENYQPKYGSTNNCISVNAITNIKPYGLTIWGNRTLKKVDSRGTVATNFLNTRNMISDIKKLSYNTAKSLMFEQDNDALWLRFKSGVSPLLDQLKSGAGISDYKLIKSTTKYNGKALTRGEMAAVIKIFPLYAIEYFEITVVVSDNDVSVS